MGWWKVQGTNDVIGDLPLDTLGAAVGEVVRAYQAELERKPTVAEWQALLLGVLGAEEQEARPLDVGSITGVRLESIE